MGVVDRFKGVGADGREVGHGPGFGEEVVPQGFGDAEVPHDPGAHAHGHRLKGRRGGHGDRTATVAQQPGGRLEAHLQVGHGLRHGFDHPGHLAVAAMQGAFDAGGAGFEDHRMVGQASARAFSWRQT